MGAPKAELMVGGRRLIERAVEALAGCDDVIAVVRTGITVAGARTVVNAEPERGMRSSLALAVAAAPEAGGVLVMLVDTPGIGADAVDAVAQDWRRHGGIAMASFGGRRGHPIAMSRHRWLAAVQLAGPDGGARAYLRVHASDVRAVGVTGDPVDLDTPADLTRWLS